MRLQFDRYAVQHRFGERPALASLCENIMLMQRGNMSCMNVILSYGPCPSYLAILMKTAP